jgi:hypothetical protein
MKEESSIFVAVVKEATWKVTAVGFFILVKASSCILYFYKKNMYCYFVTKKINTYSNDYKRK